MALEEYRKDMVRCTRCSCCKFIPLLSITKSKRFSYCCPAVSRYHFHSYSGSGKVICALSLIEGRIEYTDRLLHIVYNCTLCGACDLSCRIGTQIEVLEILHELRVKCVKDGKAPLPSHRPILESVRNYDNVWMQPRMRRGSWAHGLGLKDIQRDRAEVLFFVGCTFALSPDLKEVARKTARMFQRAGVDVGILGEHEPCCGSPIYTIGDEQLFRDIAKRNIDRLNSLGMKTVVTSCAGCYSMLKAHYPQLGEPLNVRVLHTSEFLECLLREGRLRPSIPVPLRVSYHDPCHLGRLSEPRMPSHGEETKILGTLVVKATEKVLGFGGVFDPPRTVLRHIPGIELVEMERIREYSWCCGSGAGVKSAFPDFALWTAAERLKEASSTGAQALVTCCPWCEKNLKDAAAGIVGRGETHATHTGGQSFLQVYDLVELLYQSLEEDGSARLKQPS